MVGDDPVTGQRTAFRLDAKHIFTGPDQVGKQVDIVIIVLALQDGGDPLQPHTGIDRRLGQVDPGLWVDLLELHEHQIPDLDETVAILVRRPRRTARDIRTVIVENLRTRTARPGIAHRPEIVRGRNADDLLVRKTGDLAPQCARLFVLGIDRHQQTVCGQRELAGHQLPSM